MPAWAAVDNPIDWFDSSDSDAWLVALLDVSFGPSVGVLVVLVLVVVEMPVSVVDADVDVDVDVDTMSGVWTMYPGGSSFHIAQVKMGDSPTLRRPFPESQQLLGILSQQ
jgi:hypothetical protein